MADSWPLLKKIFCAALTFLTTEEAIMELAIRGITIFTSDMEKMAAFYRDVLGLKLIEDTPGWKQFDAGACRLALHKGKSRVGARPPKIGFYAKDVAKAKAWLEARGAKLGEIQSSALVSFCNGKDPDGNAYAITNRA
jgi:catechol 2,3-dioxygenase-like lactoylglutathione lyase family enzyme